MFTTPIDEITFEKIEAFCHEFGEGVRVEYKQEIRYVPKIVSSFANTQGGIFLIGVKTDQNNKVVFPIQGIPKQTGLEETIQQSALMGIYPAVLPEIRLIDVPATQNVVVFVRIDESLHAPHAIQNATRIYIRTGSVTQPYELADIDRITYMLKRREDAQRHLNTILNHIKSTAYERNNSAFPQLNVIIHPIFPYRPVIEQSAIFELFQHLNYMCRVSGGVAFILKSKEYTEFNKYGIVYHLASLTADTRTVDYESFFVRLTEQLIHTSRLYQKCAYLGNIEVRVDLTTNISNTQLQLPETGKQRLHGAETTCVETGIHLTEQCFALDLLQEEACIKLITEFSRQLFWAYNVPDNVLPAMTTLIHKWYKQLKARLS